MTGVSGPRCSSNASFTSESTNALSHCAIEQPTGELRARRCRRAVDDARVAVHRIDAEAHPREVGERHPGDQHHVDGGIGAQQRHRALGDRGAPGHRVHHLAVLVRGGDETRRDLRVRRLEIGGGVVDVVERRERHPVGGEVVDRGMPQRARVPVRRRRRAPHAPPAGGGRRPPVRGRRRRPGPATVGVLAGRLRELAQPVGGHTPYRGFQSPYRGSTCTSACAELLGEERVERRRSSARPSALRTHCSVERPGRR